MSALSDVDFSRITKLIQQKTGMVIDEAKRPGLAATLDRRMAALALFDVRAYYDYLWFNEEGMSELRTLLDATLINETLFYRFHPQIRILTEEVFPRLLAERLQADFSPCQEPIRVWSAGCSTGAEPFTIVMAFEEARRSFSPRADGVDIAVLGTDISTSAMAVAAEAFYNRRPVENAPPEIIERYFIKEGRDFRVIEPIREKVTFRQLNLVEGIFPAGLDVIFCRNVFIYFDNPTRERILERFYTSLKPDGQLFLGHTETLQDFPEMFLPQFREEAVYYTKWTTDRRLKERRGKPRATHPDRRDGPKERQGVFARIEDREVIRLGSAAPIRAAILVLKGVLDAHTDRSFFKETVMPFLARPEAVKILDLSEVAFADNTVLRVLRQALVAAKRAETNAYIVAPNRPEYYHHFQLADFNAAAVIAENQEHLERILTGGTRAADAVSEILTSKFEPLTKSETRTSNKIQNLKAKAVAVQNPTIRLVRGGAEARLTLSGNLDVSVDPDLLRRLKEEIMGLVGDHGSGVTRIRVSFERAAFISAELLPILARAEGLARTHRLEWIVEADDEKTRLYLLRNGLPGL